MSRTFDCAVEEAPTSLVGLVPGTARSSMPTVRGQATANRQQR
jgi:hypothetical protein